MRPIFTTEFVWADAVIIPGRVSIPVNPKPEKMIFDGLTIKVTRKVKHAEVDQAEN